MDKNLDLDDLSDDIWLGGSLESPVLATSTFRVDSLLNRIDQPESQATIGVDPISEVVTLYYDGGQEEYGMNEINDDFNDFQLSMTDLTISDVFAGNEVVNWLLSAFGSVAIPQGLTQNYPIDIPLTSINDDTRKIDHIDFKQVDITLKLNTTNLDIKNANVLKVTLQQFDNDGHLTTPDDLSGYLNTGTGETTISFSNKSFVLDCNQPLQAVFEVTGDGQTTIFPNSTISAELSFQPTDYVVWGWFNFSVSVKTPLKTAEVTTEIDKYISGESVLIFSDPRILFDVTSSVGSDLVFELIDLETIYKDGTTKKIDKTSTPLLLTMDGATTPGIDKFTSVLLNKDLPGFDNESDTIFTHMFSTDLDSLTANYKVRTARTDLNNTTQNNIQFIASNSKMDVKIDAELPFSLQKGSYIEYTETVKTDFGKDIKAEDTDANILLYLDYVNTLPIDVNVKVYRLDENENLIPNQTVWEFSMKANTNTKTPATLLPIKLKDYLEEDVKYLKFEYNSGAPLTSEVSILGSNYFQIQAGVKLDGHINVNDKK
jgi:hypothetical protein